MDDGTLVPPAGLKPPTRAQYLALRELATRAFSADDGGKVETRSEAENKEVQEAVSLGVGVLELLYRRSHLKASTAAELRAELAAAAYKYGVYRLASEVYMERVRLDEDVSTKDRMQLAESVYRIEDFEAAAVVYRETMTFPDEFAKGSGDGGHMPGMDVKTRGGRKRAVTKKSGARK